MIDRAAAPPAGAPPVRPIALARSAVLSAALSLASLPFLVPHVVEDLHLGLAERVGLPGDTLAAIVGLMLAAQMLGAALAAQGRALGVALIAATAATWTLGALWDHARPLALAGLGFRGRSLSAVWVSGLIALQGAAALSALLALRARPATARTSAARRG